MSIPLSKLGEDATIAALARVLAPQALPAGWVGIGDDCAVTGWTAGTRPLTTTDLLIEDVHFRRGTTSPADLGWKALAVNASDIAGMGGRPRWATFSLALPPDMELAWLEELYRGAAALATAFDLPIVGGDTVASPGPLMLAVTVVGEAVHPVLRSTARPGDVVAVTGELGTAAAGLWVLEHPEAARPLGEPARAHVLTAHRRPVPHVAQGLLLAPHATAMMDNSDGLARSVLWLARASGLAIELDGPLPVGAATREVAALAGADPQDWALYGGEEYHLVFTAPPEALRGLPCTQVGRCVPGSGAVILDHEQRRPLEERRVYQAFPAS